MSNGETEIERAVWREEKPGDANILYIQGVVEVGEEEGKRSDVGRRSR